MNKPPKSIISPTEKTLFGLTGLIVLMLLFSLYDFFDKSIDNLNAFEPTTVTPVATVVKVATLRPIPTNTIPTPTSSSTSTPILITTPYEPSEDVNPAFALDNLTPINTLLYFSITNKKGVGLWRVNYQQPNAVLVKQMSERQGDFLSDFINVHSKLYFILHGNDGNTSLWMSDGTENGTQRVLGNNLTIQYDHNHPNLIYANEKLFFAADNGNFGTELWVSNGSKDNRTLLKDINPTGSSNPRNFTQVNRLVYFVADGKQGVELWKSDGTVEGTVFIKEFHASPIDSQPDNLTNVNGKLFFTADDGTNGVALWRSNGIKVGTIMIKDLASIEVDLENYFWAISENGEIAQLSELTFNYLDWSPPKSFINVNDTLFFSGRDGHGYELWRSDGTEAGTLLVKDINIGVEGSNPNYIIENKGVIFFQALDIQYGMELWHSDGTITGTQMLLDLNPGRPGSHPVHLIPMNGKIFFAANNGRNGQELWVSDGSETGTSMIADLNQKNGRIALLTPVQDILYFYVTQGRINQKGELWSLHVQHDNFVLTQIIIPATAYP